MSEQRSHVRIYTKRWCLYCLAAKRLFRRLDVAYEELPVDHDAELRWKASEAAGGWETVPMIFVGCRFVGGYREVRRLHAQGRLLPMLGANGRRGP